MTWEADIVSRAGKLSVSGQFKIASESEFHKFIDKLNELAGKSFLRQRPYLYQPSNVDCAAQSMARVRAPAEKVSTHNQPGRPKKTIPRVLPPSLKLPARQQQVFELTNKGLSRAQVADRVGISSDMVSYHLSELRKKIAKAEQ